MKANELMIGDWVQFSNSTPIKSRINCISPYQRYAGHTDNATWFDSFNDIEPIHLTEEILNANGFTSENGGFWDFPNMLPYGVVLNDNDYIKVRPTVDDGVYFALRYVHELQHALRLCGLTELADNFKIK